MLTEKQIDVLRLHSQGKAASEIARETESCRSSVDYALKSGKRRLEKMIEAIKFAIENNLLDEKQLLELRKALEGLEYPGLPGLK